MTDYTPPGVRKITDLDTPSVSAQLDRPTVIGLVAPARGHQEIEETFVLVDNIPQVLEGFRVTTSPVSTIRVVDAIDKNITYSDGTHYVVSYDPATGRHSVARKLYTTIPASQNVVLIAKPTGGNVVSQNFTITGNTVGPIQIDDSVGLEVSGSALTLANVHLQRAGYFTFEVGDDDADIEVNATASTCTIERTASTNVVDGQTVYVSYTVNNGATAYVNEEHTLSGTSPVSLTNEASNVDTGSIVIKNVESAVSDVVVTYNKADIDSPGSADYLVDINTSGSPINLQVSRNTTGPTIIGTAANRGQVVVSYEYIPETYYYPTEMTSLSDVENKYGPALAADGTIDSPLTFAAAMAFSNGANQIWCQALFTETTQNGVLTRSQGSVSNIADWTKTLAALRTTEDINVIVPITTDSASVTDSVQLQVFQEVVAHINNLNADGQYAIGIFGEDATRQPTVGDRATPGTLREHAQSLSGSAHPERTVLISPASYSISNPRLGGALTNIGGQYIAAAVAGMLGARSIQTPLTRKTIANVSRVNSIRTESEKNQDAAAGLLVVESKNGAIRVRHAITNEIDNVYLRELSAVRAKFFMIESVRRTIDSQLIGQIIADARAPFTVTATVQGVLELLKASGALVDYANVTAKALPNQPTAIEVRWSYALPYPLNYVDIVMSLDTATGAVTVQ